MPFECRTICKPDNFWPFEYWTSPVLSWLLYLNGIIKIPFGIQPMFHNYTFGIRISTVCRKCVYRLNRWWKILWALNLVTFKRFLYPFWTTGSTQRTRRPPFIPSTPRSGISRVCSRCHATKLPMNQMCLLENFCPNVWRFKTWMRKLSLRLLKFCVRDSHGKKLGN